MIQNCAPKIGITLICDWLPFFSAMLAAIVAIFAIGDRKRSDLRLLFSGRQVAQAIWEGGMIAAIEQKIDTPKLPRHPYMIEKTF